MREAAEGLRIATNAAAQNAIKKRLVNKLEVEEPGERRHTPQGGTPTRRGGSPTRRGGSLWDNTVG